MGESYDDHDLQVDGDGLWGDSAEGCDCDRGRGWDRGNGHASPGWAYGHETSGWAYGHETGTHGYQPWRDSDGHTVRPSGHGYGRVHNGGRAADQQMRQEH